MTKRSLINIFNRSYSAVVGDLEELTKIIKSKLKHERNTLPRFPFPLLIHYVVLRRKNEFGEEIVVSALLGPPIAEEEIYEEGLFPYTGLMKVCIKKPGLSSILRFDCGCIGKCEGCSAFSIQNAYYLPSSSSWEIQFVEHPCSGNALHGECVGITTKFCCIHVSKRC
ncbi:hypothetical protein MKX01_002678 [Papaver californicum]|nr:hypothetical protein MKX01_002678 [Papaver californicum]